MFSLLKAVLGRAIPRSLQIKAEPPAVSGPPINFFDEIRATLPLLFIPKVRILDVLRQDRPQLREAYLQHRSVGLPDIDSVYAERCRSVAKETFLNYDFKPHIQATFSLKHYKITSKVRDVAPADQIPEILNELGLDDIFSFRNVQNLLGASWPAANLVRINIASNLDTEFVVNHGDANPASSGVLGYASRAAYRAVLPDLLKGAVAVDIQRELGITLRRDQLLTLFSSNSGPFNPQDPLSILNSRAIKNLLTIYDFSEREGLTPEEKQTLVNTFYRTARIEEALSARLGQKQEVTEAKESSSAAGRIVSDLQSRIRIVINQQIPESHPLRSSPDWPKAERWLMNVSSGNFDSIGIVIRKNPTITDLKQFVALVRDLAKEKKDTERRSRKDTEVSVTKPSQAQDTLNQIVVGLNINGKSPFNEWYDREIRGTSSEEIVSVLLERLKTPDGGNRKALQTSPRIYEIRSARLGGLRIYYGLDGQKIVLLNGGNKSGNQQQADIDVALATFQSYQQNRN